MGAIRKLERRVRKREKKEDTEEGKMKERDEGKGRENRKEEGSRNHRSSSGFVLPASYYEKAVVSNVGTS